MLADAVVAGALVLAVASRISPSARALGSRVVGAAGVQALPIAALVAVVTTAGSLYYSEVAGFVPCELCWYQRICMYPLSVLLVVAALRKATGVGWYVAPLVVVGAPLALYHWLVERVPSLADSVSCSAAAPCAVPWFEEIGFVTLAFMDLSAFLLVGALMLVDRACVRARETEVPT